MASTTASTMRIVSWFARLSIGRIYEEALNRSTDEWYKKNALFGTLDEVRDVMQAFVDAGVSRFIVEILDIHDEDFQSSVLEKLIPQFQLE